MSAAAPPAPAPPARPDPAGPPAPAPAPGRLWLPVGRGEILALAGLTLAAALLRLSQLAKLPPGLHVDEAYNILDAWAVMEGWRPVFLPANPGREVLYSYLQAALLAWTRPGCGSCPKGSPSAFAIPGSRSKPPSAPRGGPRRWRASRPCPWLGAWPECFWPTWAWARHGCGAAPCWRRRS